VIKSAGEILRKSRPRETGVRIGTLETRAWGSCGAEFPRLGAVAIQIIGPLNARAGWQRLDMGVDHVRRNPIKEQSFLMRRGLMTRETISAEKVGREAGPREAGPREAAHHQRAAVALEVARRLDRAAGLAPQPRPAPRHRQGHLRGVGDAAHPGADRRRPAAGELQGRGLGGRPLSRCACV